MNIAEAVHSMAMIVTALDVLNMRTLVTEVVDVAFEIVHRGRRLKRVRTGVLREDSRHVL